MSQIQTWPRIKVLSVIRLFYVIHIVQMQGLQRKTKTIYDVVSGSTWIEKCLKILGVCPRAVQTIVTYPTLSTNNQQN